MNQVPQETIYASSGGLASLLATPNNAEGLLGLQQVADKLAEFGRNEDTYIVHAAEGETVIPSQVFDANPHLKQSLFRQMQQMGLDPDQYIIGNELNSINPVTGQPEFFFKKIFKGLKSVVKKVAPVVLPVALSTIPGLGPIFGSALGGGLSSLLQGGDFKSALKAGLITGGIGGLYSGLSGGLRAGQGNFAKGFQKAIGQDLMRPFNVMQGLPAVPTTTAPLPEATKAPLTEATGTQDIMAADPRRTYTYTQDPGEALAGIKTGGGAYMPSDVNRGVIINPAAPTAQPLPSLVAAAPERNLFERAGDYMVRGGQSREMVADAQRLAGDRAFELRKQEVLARGGGEALANSAALQAADLAAKRAGPGLVQRFGPSLAVGAGTLAAMGAFKQPEEPEEVDFFEQRYGPDGTVTSRIAENRFAVQPPEYVPLTTADIRVPSRFVAKGGSIDHFPPRIGAISGPGTGTSDDVPAMLSDGEFVMTAQAVRGAGNGSRERGMKNMYDLMRRFEGGSVA